MKNERESAEMEKGLARLFHSQSESADKDTMEKMRRVILAHVPEQQPSMLMGWLRPLVVGLGAAAIIITLALWQFQPTNDSLIGRAQVMKSENEAASQDSLNKIIEIADDDERLDEMIVFMAQVTDGSDSTDLLSDWEAVYDDSDSLPWDSDSDDILEYL
jgi:hypothetical protein